MVEVRCLVQLIKSEKTAKSGMAALCGRSNAMGVGYKGQRTASICCEALADKGDESMLWRGKKRGEAMFEIGLETAGGDKRASGETAVRQDELNVCFAVAVVVHDRLADNTRLPGYPLLLPPRCDPRERSSPPARGTGLDAYSSKSNMPRFQPARPRAEHSILLWRSTHTPRSTRPQRRMRTPTNIPPFCSQSKTRDHPLHL